MLADEVAGLEEVAAALGRPPAWLKRNWLKLHQREGFPRRIPAGDVWPRRAVEVWLRTAGLAAPPLADNQNAAGVDPVSAAAAMLRERYGAQP